MNDEHGTIRVGKKSYPLQKYAFGLNDQEVEVKSCTLDEVTDSSFLPHCYSTKIGAGVLIRSGRIDTDLKLNCLMALVEKLNNKENPWRLSCSQLEETEGYWEQIATQNRELSLANTEPIPHSRVVHLNTPFPHFFHHPPDSYMLASMRERLLQLPLQINMEALAQYCAWVYEDLQKVFNTFKHDAADEYQLEARIVDFKNEVDSYFLKDKLVKLKALYQKQAFEKDLSDAEHFEIEKQLVVLRGGIKRTIEKRYHLLEEMMWLIDTVQEAHPDLVPIGEQVLLLKTLLGSAADVEGFLRRGWVSQFMLIHLLNRRLGVITAMNCGEGGHQTNFAFAFSLAAATMDEELKSRAFLDLTVDWDTRTTDFNKKLAKELLTPALIKEEPLIVRFRQRVYSIMRDFVVGAGDYELQKGMIQDPDFLNLLPSSFQTKSGKLVRLVEYDSETGTPQKLTFAADRVMTQIVV